jgi:hypothetical protein
MDLSLPDPARQRLCKAEGKYTTALLTCVEGEIE